jgi:pantoate--beta-alanine ligase
METETTIAAVRERVLGWRRAGQRVALVPTMGSLHQGHVSLIATARSRAARCVASLFVNPTQFGPREDFGRYPRSPEADGRMLQEAGCDLLFMPEVKEMYPGGTQEGARVQMPGLSAILEGEVRPGHFDGVATVVSKLFNIVQPDVAVFGEKDFQQLTVIRRMVADLCMPVEIVGAPTVRAADGLALSSRNQYLSQAERQTAPQLHAALAAAAQRVSRPGADLAAVERDGLAQLAAAGFTPDYFTVRDSHDLAVPAAGAGELVILAAARLGTTRLIDNVRVRR